MVDELRGGSRRLAAPPADEWMGALALSPIPAALASGNRLTWANARFAELVGVPELALAGLEPAAVIGPAFPTPSSSGSEPSSSDRSQEGEMVRPDGTSRWVWVHSIELDDGAHPDPQTLIQVVDLTHREEERRALVRSQHRTEKLLTDSRDVVLLVDPDGQCRFSSAREGGAMGYGPTFWSNVNLLDMVHPDDRARRDAAWTRLVQRHDEVVEAEVRMQTATGEWVDVVVTGINRMSDPEINGLIVTARNVSDLRSAQRLAGSQASVLELIARSAPPEEVFERCVDLMESNGVGGRSSIYILDDDDRLVLLAGRAPEALNEWVCDPPHDPPRSLCDRAMTTDQPAICADISKGDAGLREIGAQIGMRAAWSHPIVAISSGRTIGSLSTIYEKPHEPSTHEMRVADVATSLVSIALERIATEDRLSHLALHDGLTGLPNRTLLLDRLDHALARRSRSGQQVTVLFCDLDRFKVVNDSLGLGAGDELLVTASQRLRSAFDPGDTVARFGGDEFVVLLEGSNRVDGEVAAGERMARQFDEPFSVGNQAVRLSVSVGVAVADEDHDADSLVRDAETAMQRAKGTDAYRVQLFESLMRDEVQIRVEVELDLLAAIERDELVVHYQPVLDLGTGRITGAEALVRWDHPTRGLLGPDHFITVAEESGAIEALGRHVLDRAVRDMSELVASTGIDAPVLGVNVSARQLAVGRFDQLAESICHRHGWPLEKLLLEITETALTPGVSGPLEVLTRLRSLGAQLAIDDFGTGHSSLTRLGRLPVGQVKIDRSFVEALGSNGDDRLVRMVDAVVAVARALDLDTTAEGVETVAQLEYLRQIGCGQAQGFLFSHPLPLDELRTLLTSDPSW